jgi:hypothetical protein
MKQVTQLQKTILIITIFLAVSSAIVAWPPAPPPTPRPHGVGGVNPSLTIAALAERVPKGKVYVFYNRDGKKIAQFRSGQKTNMGTDCVIIKCPPTFGKDVVCWKCMGFTAQPQDRQTGTRKIDRSTAPSPGGSPSRGVIAGRGYTFYQGWQGVVPKGKTYIVYNAQGKKVAQFRSGQKTNMTTDCVIINCSTVGKDVVCWKCPGFTAR